MADSLTKIFSPSKYLNTNTHTLHKSSTNRATSGDWSLVVPLERRCLTTERRQWVGLTEV